MLETGHGKKMCFFAKQPTPTNLTCHNTADCPLY